MFSARSPRAERAVLALSGAALVLGYPPFSIPILPFVGVVPLLLFLDSPRSNRDVAIGSAAFAVPYFLGTVGWLFLLSRFTSAGAVAAAFALLLHLSTFALFPAAMVLARRSGRFPLAVTAPVFWVMHEHARTFGDLDFAWATLGSALSDRPSLIQHADLVGVWGLSFWVLLVNALVATSISSRRSRRVRFGAAAGIVLTVALPVLYGVVRTSRLRSVVEAAPRLRVAAVQPNIPQRLKWSPAAREANVASLNRVVRRAEKGDAELVVAPEACLPLIMDDDAPRLPDGVEEGSRPLLLGVVRGIGDPVPVVEGGLRGHRYERHYNSVVLAGPGRDVIDAHDKATLVPMTEAIPFRRAFGFILPFMRKQFGRFEPGLPPRPLELRTSAGEIGLGALICFEVLKPSEVRDVVDRGADVLVAVTNDAWFGRSNMPWHHLGLAVVRAIEVRRSVVRSANTGISALVDPLGRVIARTELFEETVLAGEVPILDVKTVYCRLGDFVLWILYGAGAAIVVVTGWSAPARPVSSRAPRGG